MLFAERYELLERAGEGGMGVVFRAYDRREQKIVALKLTQRESPEQVKWLEREALVLGSLNHSSIPAFIDWGCAEGGRQFLAMEWVEGEELGTRLKLRVLSVEDIVAVGIQIAEALIEVHENRLVHRDLKPPNILLAGGDVRRLKILDFGIACFADDIDEQLRTGPIGTPFYMAPEQAKGGTQVDSRADLYALGCILFECLTGKPPFIAASPLGVLAKTVFETPIAPGEVRPGVPAFLDALVMALLEKDPEHRPPSAFAVAEELNAFRKNPQGKAAPHWSLRRTLTRNERRMVSVVLAAEAKNAAAVSAARVSLDVDRTLDAQPHLARPLQQLRQLAAAHGALLEVMRDGSIAAALSSALTPLEGAMAAANLALEMHMLVPEARVALVTAWEVFKGAAPVGQAIDRASALLSQSLKGEDGPGVLVDAMTASLLHERFALVSSGDKLRLLGAKASVLEQRLLMGKATRCVGREQEIGTLHDALEACLSARIPKAILLTAGAGIGKSRVRDEFLRDVVNAHHDAEIWIARGDPMRQKSAFGLLVQFVQHAASLVVGEPPESTQTKLSSRVARHVETPKLRRVCLFLAELVSAPYTALNDMQLDSARQDSMVMGDQIRRAWLDFLEAECKAHPVVLVMEDLHWGDVPTVDSVNASLRLLSDVPLFVLALGRPEIEEEFPNLWREHDVLRVELQSLPDGACAELVDEVLGASISDATKQAMIERANGNAFFLEELIRATAEGRGENVPDTVLGMMAARLVALDADVRRVLRAGSIFGMVFWRGAVLQMLGLDAHSARLDAFLGQLEKAEWIMPRAPAKFLGETEYVFRHALIRDAAYKMLTREDKQLGHRLAGEWLVRSGETEAMTLAEHFDRGGEAERAAFWYGEAAQQALQGNDLKGAIARADKSIELGAAGELLGKQYVTKAEAERWAGNFVDAAKLAQRALEIFPKASELWFGAAREAVASMVDSQFRDDLFAMADVLEDLWMHDKHIEQAQLGAVAWATIQLYQGTHHERGDVLFQHIEKIGSKFHDNMLAHASILMVKAFRDGFVTGDISACGAHLKEAGDKFEACGDLRSACHMRVNLGHVYNEVGAYKENASLMDMQKGLADRLGLKYQETVAELHLGKSQLFLNELGPAKRSLEAAAQAFQHQGETRLEGNALTCLAMLHQRCGLLDEAEKTVKHAIEVLNNHPSMLPYGLAVLAGILLEQNRLDEALRSAKEAYGLVDRAEEAELFIRLKHAEVLYGSGHREEAMRALEDAAARLVKRADSMMLLEWRTIFLENVYENARIQSLQREWNGKPI